MNKDKDEEKEDMEENTEKEKRLQEKIKELGLKYARKYYVPFNYNGIVYDFLDSPQEFMKNKVLLKNNTKNLHRKLIRRANRNYGF